MRNASIDFNEERTVGGGKEVSDLSLEVENECPMALQLGGLKGGLGEGIVWTEVRRFSQTSYLLIKLITDFVILRRELRSIG